MNLKLLIVVLILSYAASPSMGQVGLSVGSADVPVSKEDLKNLNGKQKTDRSTSLFARPGQPVGLASRMNQLEAEFRQKIEEIKTNTSRSIKDHDEKITKIMGWEHKLAHLLNQSMEVVKELKTQNRDQSKRIDQLEQKLATLQNTPPASSALMRSNYKEKMKNGTSYNNGQVSKPSTPPSSCEELAMLDYYLNGFYLVKNKQTKKIQTVFCKFSAGENRGSQDLIGNIDVKKKNVHFYVQRNTSFSSTKSAIPFELARLNEGGAFDLPSGVFTAPVAGIYHFYFSVVKGDVTHDLGIILQVNGVDVGTTYTSEGPPARSFNTASLGSSLRLEENDRVRLFNFVGALIDNSYHQTHFTGWLVEEDLI